MASEQYRQRSDFLGTQIITRDTGKRLGIVTQLWVDVDRREVVALGIRENILSGVLSGMEQMMYLSDIRQVGDVVLVDDDNVTDEDINTEPYSILINSQVITETGEVLGKVRGFRFDVNSGKVDSLIVATLGIPQIPDQVLSTYELSMEEVVSSGPDRLIVFEGAEEKLTQLTVGVLERLGIGRPPWERDLDEEYIMPTAVSNQLGTGLPTSPAPAVRTSAPTAQETWDEDNWNEPRREIREPLRQPEPEPIPYEQEANWGGSPAADYREVAYAEPEPYVDAQPDYARSDYAPSDYVAAQYEEVPEDAWADDDNPQPYQPPQINIPERKKAVEYEEETDY
jgi:sporulation protein YlmC with PRC-barrel domain